MADGSGSLCSVCGRVIMVTSRGLIRSHSPKSSRCQGSSLPPSKAGLSVPSPSQAQPESHSVGQPSSSVPSGLSPRSSPVTELCSLPSGRRIVRKIPKGSHGSKCPLFWRKLSPRTLLPRGNDCWSSRLGVLEPPLVVVILDHWFLSSTAR